MNYKKNKIGDSKKGISFALIFFIVLFFYTFSFQRTLASSSTYQSILIDSLKKDSLSTKIDSLSPSLSKKNKEEKSKSLATTTSKEEKIVLEDIINFSAKDSVVMLGQKDVYFFGESKVDYQAMKMKANYMKINIDKSEVYAQYILDEKGYPTAYPVFSDGKQNFETESMLYNFSSEKGYIKGVLTQQGEGYLTSEESMRLPDNTMYIKRGKYTTCDNHHNPHFYILLTKAKVVPDKNIVAGPAYMVMAGVPLYPIGLPFGFFPFNEKRSSGIIMPSYGDELERGFYLRGGGFYWAINDYMDLRIRGDVYTLGSWGLSASSNYIKRYKYTGNVDLNFVSTVRGDKKIPNDYSSSKDFSVNWSHRQDPKVDPLRNFSASVNFSTSSYNHNSTKEMYNPDRRAQNTKGSSVSYSRKFIGIPLNITGAFNIDQRSVDSTLSVSFPNLSVSLGTVYPFKKKKRVGKEKWYEKIAMSYTASFRNSITTKEKDFFKKNLLKDWRHAIRHSIPISASFDLFNYIKITPSISYNGRIYTSKINRVWDEKKQTIVPADTTYGFYYLHDYSASISTSTTLYGFYKPWKIFGDKVQMIRHRFTPSISFSYTPGFNRKYLGYYKKITFKDKDGVEHEEVYSPFRHGMFGVPPEKQSGNIRFNFTNNLEMKIRKSKKDENDEEAFKKISLIDQLNWGVSYNMMADSLRWSNINASIALRFSPQFTLRLSGDFDTYLYDYVEDKNGNTRVFKVNKLRLTHGKGLGRLTRTGTGFSYNFNNETGQKIKSFFNRLFGIKEEEEENKSNDKFSSSKDMNSNEDERDPNSFSRNKGLGPRRASFSDLLDEKDDDGYIKWNFPWNFSFNYSMNLGYDMRNFDKKRKEYPYKLTHNLSFRGDIKPTKNWSFMFDANYNFDLKKITNMQISFTRDLHCWQFTGNIIPLGPYKSYSIMISVKSSILKDLKYEQSSLPNSSSSRFR